MSKKVQLAINEEESTFLTDFFLQLYPLVNIEDEKEQILAKNLRDKIVEAYAEAEEVMESEESETTETVETESLCDCENCDCPC